MLLRIANRIIVAYAFVPLGFLSLLTRAQEIQRVPAVAPSANVEWKSTDARHAYGLPDSKPNKSGTLTLDATSLTFTSKASNTTIPRGSITAVSAGNDRVELWGTAGQLMRMVIPDGGGLAAAALMHHRVDMLTVEFSDTRGGVHSAVFYLPAKEADHALEIFTKDPPAPRTATVEGCGANPVDAHSVLVEVPDWNRVEVPAAYRALVYEHVIDRLRTAKQAGHVYRIGEIGPGTACPQYTINIAIEGYKKGNQVVRSATGPLGMFLSTTQMTFSVTYGDLSTGLKKSEEIKASIRSQSESTGVADAVAKKLAKQYRAIVKTATMAPASAAAPPTETARS